LEIGFNSGQFHHGVRKDEQLIKRCLEAGLLIDKGLTYTNYRKNGEIDEGDSTTARSQKAFGVFENKCLIFPLRNQQNKIVSFYGRSIKMEAGTSRHFYLKNRSGIYPNYPGKETKKLILTEAIIDCASLLQIPQIKENYSLISCFGTNGLNEEILNAIKNLENLEEIIFCFDQDDAGKKAVKKYAEEFKNYKISTIELPNNDINETLQLHDENVFVELLNNRNEIYFFSLDFYRTRKKNLNYFS
jgi:DNA primase